MNASEHFEKLVRQSRAAYMKKEGNPNWIGDPLTDEESKLILRGIDANLIRFNETDGRFELIGFAHHQISGFKSYQIFNHWKENSYWAWREMFIQIGFAVELVLEWGWPSKLLAFETKGFDIVAMPDSPIIMAEAKVKEKDLIEQLRVFRTCGSSGSKTNLNRYRDLWEAGSSNILIQTNKIKHLQFLL